MSSQDGDTSANERTSDGTDDDLNDGSNDDKTTCTHEPNMSPTSEESSGGTNGYMMRSPLESVAIIV